MNLFSVDSVAIITGASSGVGRAAALTLAERGLRLSLLARSESALSEVAGEARDRGASDVLHFVCDVRDEAAVDRAVASTLVRFGGGGVLVNTAGVGFDGGGSGFPRGK